MEAVKGFMIRNPDVPTKLKATTVAFFVLALPLCAYTGYSILTSLVLTFLHTVVYAVILYYVREHNILDSQNSLESHRADYQDSDYEEYVYDVDRKSPFSVVNRPHQQNYFRPDLEERHSSSRPRNRVQHRFPPGSTSISPLLSDSMSGYEQTTGIKPGDHSGRTPESPGFLGVNRYNLQRNPLRPVAINTPMSPAFSQNLMYRKHAKQRAVNLMSSTRIGRSSQVPSSRGPQTSSPFHEKSQLGLWDTMGVSAIASPNGFISPIGSPAREGTLNRSSPYMYSPSSGERANKNGHPLHTTGQPLDPRRHSQPKGALSSHWQRWTQRPTTVRVTGRPRLQSPVTIRIAQPDKSPASPETRYLNRPPVQQDPPDSLRKDVILSALRDKRKRGKQGLDESDAASPDQSSMEGGSHIKKRRLNITDASDSRPAQSQLPKRVQRPLKSTSQPSGAMLSTPAGRKNSRPIRPTKEEAIGKGGEDRSADSSMDVTAASTSFHRNAIVSSLSSSQILKGRNRKRGLQTDGEEPTQSAPPKKVSKSTDVAGLNPKDTDNDEGDGQKSTEEGATEISEASQEQEPQRTTIAPRSRKKAVFSAIHRGKRAKPPSPQQVTAADLHEDRQRALERSQQMRMLLRDETAKPKEAAKDSDKPLLPTAKLSSKTATPSSILAVKPTQTSRNITVVDSGAGKTLKPGKNFLTELLKDDPVTKKSAEQKSKTDTVPTTNLATSSGQGLFGNTSLTATAASPLSISVAAPTTTQSPLLQALSGMKGTTPSGQSPGQTTLSTSTLAGGLGLSFGQGNPLLASPSLAAPTTALAAATSSLTSSTSQSGATSSSTFSFGGGAVSSSGGIGGLSGITGSSAPTSTAQPSSQPSLQFGSGSPLLQMLAKDQPDLKKTTAQPTFNFGGAPSISLGTGLAAAQPSAQQQGMSQPPPAYGSSLTTSSGQAPSSTLAPLSTHAPSSSFFNFGGGSTPAAATTQPAPVATQRAAATSTFSFGGSANPSKPTTSATTTSGSFGATGPSFNFGQSAATTTSQQAAPSSLFSFPGGSTTAAATATASTGLFSFGAPAASTTTTTPSLFQAATPAQALKTTAGAAAAPSPFNFGAATPRTTSTGSAASAPAFAFGGQSTSSSTNNASAKPTFNFGGQATASSSSGFGFGSQQAAPATQSTLFGPTAQAAPQSSSGFSFGGQTTPVKPLFPATAQQQPQQQQTGFPFSSQPAAGPSFGSSASTPAFGFGSSTQNAPAAAPSPFQFGGASAPALTQQQSTTAFNFSGSAKPSTLAFGATASAPQFGQQQPASTPPRAAGGFNMGSSVAPRKSASARMRHRARAGRK